MQILNPEFEADGFFARVREAPRRVLLLDYDGTLAPFVADRSRAQLYPGVPNVLAALAVDARTRLAIVSGRPLDDLVRMVGMPLELWGSHGLEHQTAAGVRAVTPSTGRVRKLLAEASRWVLARVREDLLEVKPFGLALHARAAPDDFSRIGPEVLARWSGPAREAGLEVRMFDAGIEFRPAGVGKGVVVERTLGEEAPDLPAAYLGDDDTDEDAFAAIQGRGLAALVRPFWRQTRADVWLCPPADLVAFLKRWLRGDPVGGRPWA